MNKKKLFFLKKVFKVPILPSKGKIGTLGALKLRIID